MACSDQPIRPGQPRLVGPAFTLRFVPAREDLATPASWASPISTRAAIEAMPEGCIAVAGAMGIIDAGMEDALDLVTELKQLANGREIRIFYCLVENDLKRMMTAKRAGATDFLLKPFDRRSLTSAFAEIQTAA